MQSGRVFKAVFYCLCGIAGPLGRAVFRNRPLRCARASSKAQLLLYSRPREIVASCPHLSDFAPTIFLTLCFIVARYAFVWVTAPLGRHVVRSRHASKQVLATRVTRFSHNLFRFLYFASITSCAYYVLNRESITLRDVLSGSFFETLLGTAGGQRVNRLIQPPVVQPFVEPVIQPATAYFIRFYFCLSAAFQLASLYFLFAQSQFTDFWESCAQVALALQLLFFGYMANYLVMGACIMLMHDVCDILTAGCKTLVDSTYKIPTFLGATLLVVVWAYLRLFSLAKRVMIPLMKAIELGHPLHQNGVDYESILFAQLLLILFFMNIYWFSLMVKSCIIFVASGRVTDSHCPELTVVSGSSPSCGVRKKPVSTQNCKDRQRPQGPSTGHAKDE